MDKEEKLIQCQGCMTWQHTDCVSVLWGPSSKPPARYQCHQCSRERYNFIGRSRQSTLSFPSPSTPDDVTTRPARKMVASKPRYSPSRKRTRQTPPTPKQSRSNASLWADSEVEHLLGHRQSSPRKKMNVKQDESVVEIDLVKKPNKTQNGSTSDLESQSDDMKVQHTAKKEFAESEKINTPVLTSEVAKPVTLAEKVATPVKRKRRGTALHVVPSWETLHRRFQVLQNRIQSSTLDDWLAGDGSSTHRDQPKTGEVDVDSKPELTDSKMLKTLSDCAIGRTQLKLRVEKWRYDYRNWLDVIAASVSQRNWSTAIDGVDSSGSDDHSF